MLLMILQAHAVTLILNLRVTLKHIILLNTAIDVPVGMVISSFGSLKIFKAKCLNAFPLL